MDIYRNLSKNNLNRVYFKMLNTCYEIIKELGQRDCVREILLVTYVIQNVSRNNFILPMAMPHKLLHL